MPLAATPAGPTSVFCQLFAGQAFPLPIAPQYWNVATVAAPAGLASGGVFRKAVGHAKVFPPLACVIVKTTSLPVMNGPAMTLLVTLQFRFRKKSVMNADVVVKVMEDAQAGLTTELMLPPAPPVRNHVFEALSN